MSSHPIYMAIEPRQAETRLMLAASSSPSALRARLPSAPAHPRALIALLESISLWLGAPLHAVVDADGADVRHHPDRWSLLLGDAPELAVRVEWVSVPGPAKRDRFVGKLGDFASAARLLSFASRGRR
jgi:hypothetical protein